MSARRVRPALQAILQSIAGIEEALGTLSLEDYAQSWTVKHSVERGIEIISEASRRIPKPLRDTRPDIDWAAVSGIGNVLRHDYDEIVDEIVYDAARLRLPALKAAVLAIAANLDEPDA